MVWVGATIAAGDISGLGGHVSGATPLPADDGAVVGSETNFDLDTAPEVGRPAGLTTGLPGELRFVDAGIPAQGASGHLNLHRGVWNPLRNERVWDPPLVLAPRHRGAPLSVELHAPNMAASPDGRTL